MRKVAADIRRWGVSIIHVGEGCSVPGCNADQSDDERGMHGYTVGLPAQYGHPELVVQGMRWATSAPLLNRVAAAVSNGLVLKAGDLVALDRDLILRADAVADDMIASGLICVSEEYHASIGYQDEVTALSIVIDA